MADKPLTKEEIATAKEIFDALDQDHDGSIDHNDMKKALSNAGYKLEDDEIKALIKMADADNSGKVSWQEFLKVVEKRPIRRRIEASLRKLFQAMDVDGSGYLTKDDLKKLLKDAGYANEISDAELGKLIAKVDTSGDGKVSFEEFVAAFLE